jgi:hypothetical protein
MSSNDDNAEPQEAEKLVAEIKQLLVVQELAWLKNRIEGAHMSQQDRLQVIQVTCAVLETLKNK